ncbi:hypothetical protein CA234_02965 [Sphingomonas sp. ABOLE]|uniref:hypothetical protein n=1 Tax=Sphingomonas sp. ABOLE TaxID=1985878 RepID=UPI000F7EB57B|nr:hypothetical protein [Sphingomonas sp. ABOLE]RSV44392.1 hypothetical protein CA234_02965 [Sphingomonas sp. ABOLE]
MTRTYTCRRRGCTCPREGWQFVCEACWAQVPALLRNHLAKLRRLKLTHLAKRTEAHILKSLGRKPAEEANGPAARSARAYARIAAQMGEHAEAEAAE